MLPPLIFSLSSGQLSLASQKSALHFLDALHFLVAIFLSFDLSYLSFADVRLSCASLHLCEAGTLSFPLRVYVTAVVTPSELPPMLPLFATVGLFAWFFIAVSPLTPLRPVGCAGVWCLNHYIVTCPPAYVFSVIHAYFHTTWFGKVLDMISVFWSSLRLDHRNLALGKEELIWNGMNVSSVTARSSWSNTLLNPKIPYWLSPDFLSSDRGERPKSMSLLTQHFWDHLLYVWTHHIVISPD